MKSDIRCGMLLRIVNHAGIFSLEHSTFITIIINNNVVDKNDDDNNNVDNKNDDDNNNADNK